MKRILFIFLSLMPSIFIWSQSNAIVFGTVQDVDTKDLIELVTIYVKGENNVVESNIKGVFRIEVAPNKDHILVFTRIGYKEVSIPILSMPSDVKRNINIQLVQMSDDLNIVIRDSKIQDLGMVREEITEMKLLPSTTGNLESVLPQIALGTYGGSGGELSSQYNVRGGNYDENLVYVNDFEIFKPQLLSNSQQEGLSFPNMDLIRDLTFSSGGFESKYGDKMSSVLDVKYKRPEDYKMSAEASFLGGSLHFEGSKLLGPNAYNRLRFLLGVRYKTTKSLLGSQDLKGEYQPNFFDLQSYLTYDLTRDLQISWMSNYNSSVFSFIPEERVTNTGTFTQNLRFTAFYQGQEKDKFLNTMNGLALVYVPERNNNPYFLKLLTSHYYGLEVEAIDIEGAYRLSETEVGFGESAGEEIAVLGVGTQHEYRRNRLNSNIWNIEHKGGIEFEKLTENASKSQFVEWGLKYQLRNFKDKINEWERLDSAGFSLPVDDDKLFLASYLKSSNDITTNEFSAFAQNTFSYFEEEKTDFKLSYGARLNYLDLNKELLVSPRVQILYIPLGWNKNISFKLAGGLYYQQPFYREMRREDSLLVDGNVQLQVNLNTNLKAQKSIHVVGGVTYNFYWKGLSDKPFKLISEIYYKKLSNLVSYNVDNVRIRYSGINDSEGYVTGIDFRLNGELVRGIESWVNISVLRARESIIGVQHLRYLPNETTPTPVDDVPRPSEQIVNFSMFFQDFLPKNENFKVHIAFSFGSGLAYSRVEDGLAFRNQNRFKAYHRIDLGFSYHLWDKSRIKMKPRHLFRFSRDTWLSLEIFNLMDIKNVASYNWIRTIDYHEYAIPNFLTGRRINLKMKIEI